MTRLATVSTGAALVLVATLALEGVANAGSAPVAPAPAAAGQDADRMIRRAFDDVLDRSPTDRELRQYRDRIRRDNWDEGDIRNDLRQRRDRDDRLIRRVFDDVLDRRPNEAELRRYRARIAEDGWNEGDIRNDLRRNGGGARPRYSSRDVERIVRRAYQDILEREPDPAGMRVYRSHLLDDGWTEDQVRRELRNSDEYRERQTMTPARAQEIVRQVYLEVLGREPDPGGSRGYVDAVFRRKMTRDDVARELRASPEGRARNR